MNPKSIVKTIEEISIPNTVVDLWEGLYGKQSSRQVIISFRDGTTFKLRLLGSFIFGSRIFLPPNLKLYDKMSSDELSKMLRGDNEVFETVHQRALNRTPDEARNKLHVESIADIKRSSLEGKKIIETTNILKNLHSKFGWQPVFFSNVLILDTNASFSTSNPAILCLSKNLCYQIIGAIASSSKSANDAANKKISGLIAHDLTISRNGNGINAKYTVEVSAKESSLPKSMISFILKDSLWDIKEVIRASNKNIIHGKNMSGFLYQIQKGYRMSSELMAEIFNQARNIDEFDYMDSVEEQINELPQEAFENRTGGNSIGSLEL